MTHIQKISLLFALPSPTLLFAADVPRTILPDNVITCQVNANCTNKTLFGRTYKVINTPRFTVMVSVSQEGPYTRADVSIANNTIVPQSLSPEDFRVEVVTPKPRVLLYVPPSDLKDLPAHSGVPPASLAHSPSETSRVADSVQASTDEVHKQATETDVVRAEVDTLASQRDLSATSLPPNEIARGRVFFERDKHAQLVNVVLPIAGLVFEFPYTMR